MTKRSRRPFGVFTALMTAFALGSCSLLTGCDSGEGDVSAVTDSQIESVSETQAPTQSETAEETTKHETPVETISFTMGNEKCDINEMLDYDEHKTYKASMSDFVKKGDRVESFVFVFYAEDGSSNISTYKGGCGISVTEDCPYATDDCWYQSDDFEIDVNSAYLEVTWDVPEEIRDYVITDNKGEILIGYWWGGLQRLRLASIICKYSTTAEIPVDSTNTVDLYKTLTYGVEEGKTAKIPLDDLMPRGAVPQYFKFNIESTGELQKYAGAFAISVLDDCPDRTDKQWYQTRNIAVMTNSSSTELHWLVPDGIKDYIQPDGIVMLGYWWSRNDSVNLKSITVKYTLPDGVTDTTTVAKTTEPATEKATEAKEEKVSGMDSSSAEIVKNMKIGWNLGNTLDSCDYSEYADDGETAWGNPKTTKKMIDTVKKAGFNAVRVPVTWNDHLNGDTIDGAWLDRVEEVIGYVLDNGMYAIVNVHHDDKSWLIPDKAHESQVKERLVKIWQQLSERFKNYDEHLLFEGMNEPRVIGSADEWTHGTADEREVINNLFAAFVETVRKSGGNNSKRTLIVTGNAAAMDETAIKAIRVPDDDHVIVSIHSYHPYDFALNDNGNSTFSDDDKGTLDSEFDLLKSTFIDKGIPVIIGECGSVNKNNLGDRVKHMEYYIKSAKKRGITCFLWDNNITDGDSPFGLLNRSDCSWYYPELVDAAMKGLK